MIWVLLLLCLPSILSCPSNCVCELVTLAHWKVDCSDAGLQSLGPSPGVLKEKRLMIADLPSGTVELVLRGNELRFVPGFTFAPLIDLKLLDLSQNHLSVLSSYVFSGLDNLHTLNLTSNNIHSVNSSVFFGLPSLKRLLIAHNPLPAIQAGSFKLLQQLDFIDISSPHLSCDCNLRWLSRWVRRNDVQLSDSSICYFPLKLRGKLLSNVKRKDLLCTTFRPEVFEIRPGDSQLVFLNTDTTLSCHVTNVARQHVTLEWFHEGKVVQNVAERREITYSTTPDKSLVISTLALFNIIRADAGVWQCRAETKSSGWSALSTRLDVYTGHLADISCPRHIQSSSKGQFEWPSTQAGTLATIDCPFGLFPTLKLTNATVTRHCLETGFWLEDEILNDTHCDFASPIVRGIRDRFIGKEASLSHLSTDQIWSTLNDLIANQTSDLDSTEMDFILKAFEQLRSSGSVDELAIVSQLLNTSDATWQESQISNSAERLLEFLEIYRPFNGSISMDNVAVCQLTTGLDQALGLGYLAVWDGGNLICAPYKIGEAVGGFEKGSSWVRLPSTALKDLVSEELQILASLRFIWLNDNKLLDFDNEIQYNSTWVTESNIIGLKLDNPFGESSFETIQRYRRELEENATEVIERFPMDSKSIRFQFELLQVSNTISLGLWNQSSGFWESQESFCGLTLVSDSSLSFDCSAELLQSALNWDMNAKYAYFTALQDKHELEDLRAVKLPVVLEPWMYCAAGLLSCCLLCAAATYCFCAKHVRTSQKLRHSLINTWFSSSILCLLFTLGIDKVQLYYVCLCVSIGLHYMTLVVLLWMLVTIRTIHRKLWKSVFPPPPAEDDGMAAVSQHGPLLGLYFLSYGLPIMPAAFTAAIKLDEYTTSRTYCFLTPAPPLYGSLLLPAGLLLLICLALLLSACCIVGPKHKVVNGNGDESSQLLLANGQNRADEIMSLQSTVIDMDRPANRQIWYAGFSLLLYILACVSVVIYISRDHLPYVDRLPYGAIILSCIYCFILLLHSLLTVCAHVTARPGVRCCCCHGNESHSNKETNGVATNGRVNGTRHIGVDAVRGFPTPDPSREVVRQRRSHSPGDCLEANENERFLKAVAKRYHAKQSVRQKDDRGYISDDIINGSIPMHYSDGLQSEIIMEEDEISCHPDDHEYVNVAIAAKMLNGAPRSIDAPRTNDAPSPHEREQSPSAHSETRV